MMTMSFPAITSKKHTHLIIGVFFLILLISPVSAQPYILNTGPEEGIGLPFLDNDSSLFFRGSYIEPQSDFYAELYYAVDPPDNVQFDDENAITCSDGTVYTLVQTDTESGGPIYFHAFEDAAWIGEVYSDTAGANITPVPSYGIFYILRGGDKDDVCAFIPMFEERLRYYMNVRKNEPLLPMPAVVGAE